MFLGGDGLRGLFFSFTGMISSLLQANETVGGITEGTRERDEVGVERDCVEPGGLVEGGVERDWVVGGVERD